MITLDIPAEDINTILADFQDDGILHFEDGKLLFSHNGVSGVFELRPAENHLRFVCPNLAIKNPVAKAFFGFAPGPVLTFAHKRLPDALKESTFLLKTTEGIEVLIENGFIWDKLDFEQLPRRLKLVKVNSNAAGVRLGFELVEK